MRKIATVALATLCLAAAGIASSQDSGAMPIGMDTVLGNTAAEVTASLAGMGYDIREIETEGSSVEVTFVADGRPWEVYVSKETGRPTKIERE